MFEASFGAYHKTEFDWEAVSSMQFRNKFAVTAEDLQGTWSSTDFASMSYYYVSSGGYAGATATSTADAYTFDGGSGYSSDHSGASGVVGNQQFSRQQYKGKYTVSNWSMQLTNRFRDATEEYSCHFEAVKGGRALLITNRQGHSTWLVKQP